MLRKDKAAGLATAAASTSDYTRNYTLSEALASACAEVGIVYRDVPADGCWHEADIEGDPRGQGDGRIKLFPDGEGGIVYNWKGEQRVFFVDNGHALTEQEQAERDRKRQETIREAREEDARRHAEAREKAAAIWRSAQAATRDHPYLTRKGVKAHGVRLHNGALVIPMRDGSKLHSQQFIAEDGDKRFLTGGCVQGCYFSIGKPDNVLCIAEGFATAASIHEATGHAIAVVFTAGNLLAVAKAVRAKFPGLRLIVCADDDYRTEGNPGLRKATEAARAVGALLAVPDFGEDRPEGATDFNDLALHRGRETIQRAIADAKAPGSDETAPEEKWPAPMDPCAYYGIAGEIVQAIEPHTESDPIALLAQILVAFGILVGRTAYYQVEGDRHYSNLFEILLGETAKGRKGTSWGRVRSIFERVPGWPKVVSGLSSGEGLKWQVRDPRTEMVKNKRSGDATEEVVDEGVADKRLLVIEPEFAGVTRVVARQGNTLSSTVRSAWDTGNLATLTKHDPITATGAHISIIGHVTVDELRAELTQTDTANGFANRFLFLCVRRSKCLPFGGEGLPEDVLNAFAQQLDRAACLARAVGRVTMAADARNRWARVYPRVSEGAQGLFGAATARAEAQVVRLAMLYALLDEKAQIDTPHLLAALAVWEYASSSAGFVFGSSLGDLVADEILRAVRSAGQDGMTRTQIRDLFQRNCSVARIGAALDLLVRRNLVKRRTQETGGRPSEVWESV